MIRIEQVDQGTALAEQLLSFARNCSWNEVKAHIAEMLTVWVFTDWGTMLVATDDGEIVGMASVMKTDYYDLPEVFPWVSSIFVSKAYRGNQISGELIAYANRYLKGKGFSRSYIPSEFCGLYERYGYTFQKDIVNYGGGTDHLYAKDL